MIMKKEHKKTRWLLLIVLSLLCWTSTGDANYRNAVKSEDKIMYAIFKDGFKEPIEIIYFLFNDMVVCRITSTYENKVFINIRELRRDFKKNGYIVSDVIVIIHNHITDAYFSEADIDTYKTFRNMGFEGKFYIYVHRTKGIYELAERFR